MFLPAEIITVLAHFQPAFTQPSYQKVVVLLAGTILARGRRTVTAALRAVGLQQHKQWAKYHHLLNRASWSGLLVSQILLQVLVTTFVGVSATVDLVVDETLERRWGRHISKRGHWRDSLASSKGLNVSTSGLRWVVLALVVKLPWSRGFWALPCLSVLLTTPKVLHHSDRGSQYASDDYQALLTQHQLHCSMSRAGNCYDNAPMESFFGTLKTELIHRRHYATRAEARTDIFEFIEVFYNRFRRHSALGYLSPVNYEQLPLAA